jgi:hypothetical protein
MKTILLTVGLINFSLSCFAQIFTIENHNHKIRAGIPNTISFFLGKKFDSVSLRASNGVVEREGRIVTLTPKSLAKDTIVFKIYRRKKLIHSDTASFVISPIVVFPSFGADLFRRLTVSDITAQQGIIFFMKIFDDHWETCVIESYRFSVIRKDQVIVSVVEHTNRFSEDLLKRLDLLSPGDNILISDILVKMPHDEFLDIHSGAFTVQ